MPDSSTGGYLVPAAPTPPVEDAALDAIFQAMIVGLTGLPGNMVRPRWQPVVPIQPPPSTNWCAIGITDIDPDANPFMMHNGAGDGSDTMLRHEVIKLAVSFYGPNAMQYAAQARDGLYVSQNHAMLTANNMGLVRADRMITASELVNQQWIRRYDFDITIRRQVVRTYNVLNVLSAEGTVDSEPRTIPFSVTQ